jgi:hypothetical protein
MEITEMINQFNIKSDDDQYAKPENVFDDETRQIKHIKDACDDKLSERKLALHGLEKKC